MPVLPTYADLARRGTFRVTGHAELYKRDEQTGELTLISTTRPCEVCGRPLEGLVVPKAESKESLVHTACRHRLVSGVSLA